MVQTKASGKLLQLQKNALQPEVFDFYINSMECHNNDDIPIPTHLVLLRPNPQDNTHDQLFIDQTPIPKDTWSYHAHDRVLRWKGLFGGGQLHVSHDGLGAHGCVGQLGAMHSVKASSKAQFLCEVALNTGAKYVMSGNRVIGFDWDPNSGAWKSAQWVKNRLLLTYTVTQGSPIEPPSFTFEFVDNETGAPSWVPDTGAYGATLQLGTHNGQMVWNLNFKSNIPPIPDLGPNPATGPDTVYPLWLQAIEDASASTINGVLEIDQNAPNGNIAGFQGQRSNSFSLGYYQINGGEGTFGVFSHQLHIGGQAIVESKFIGNELHWQNLSAEQQQLSGLPVSGQLKFTSDGFLGFHERLQVSRLRHSSLTQRLNNNPSHHPTVHANLLQLNKVLADDGLKIDGLLAMNPFVQNEKGQWGDAVQLDVTKDLGDIMNSYIPTDMWNLVFPGTAQPVLSGELAIVANTPVKGYSNPGEWYQSLATAVISQGLANGSNPNCKNLNGPRAAAWLKSEVATSPVYYSHGQLLFRYHWNNRFAMTQLYLNDQIVNAGSYLPVIQAQTAKLINDINVNVVNDPNSDPNMKQDLINQVQEVSQYAQSNNLFWAFAYYTYNVAPGILANIALQIGINTGSGDATTLTRLIQQNAAVLTAMDPSGFFAKKYTQTLNVFLATNILPSMFGYDKDATDFDMIKLYMEEFVKNNLNNEDQQIAQAAANIQAILDADAQDEILKKSIDAIRSMSETIQDALALPYIATKFVTWFQNTFPRFSPYANMFGGLFISGLSGLAIFNLFSAFKSWDRLTPSEKATVITDTAELGLQIVAAIVKRGVRIYSIFSLEGMTTAQRAMAIAKIAGPAGEAPEMYFGLANIGNTTARWLGDVEGTLGKASILVENAEQVAASQASWAAKVFGRNLDEFIGARIGPIFILAGIGLSIFNIAQGEGGISLASDIINIIGGSLMIFATVGEWAISWGFVAADGILAGIFSCAGPLAIVLALAGVALMLYELFHTPPDPVEEFVNQYAKPAGFYVTSKASSIDYVIPYANKDNKNLMMIGAALTYNNQAINVNDNGTIRMGTQSALPNCVFQYSTNALGMTIITTQLPTGQNGEPELRYLSLMKDNTISFQPKMAFKDDKNQVKTQTWLSSPQNNATVTSDGNLLALGIKMQPVIPDADGKYKPSQASGYLYVNGLAVQFNQTAGSVFTLNMSGMAPNFAKMLDLKFVLNTIPSTQQSFGPSFGLVPSTPINFTLGGDPLPSFLGFNAQTGTFTPNGQSADQTVNNHCTLTIVNALGQSQVNFSIVVAATSQAV
jgi:hypothetical protein